MKVQNVFPLAVLVAGLCFVTSCALTDTGITTNVKAKFVADDLVKSSQLEVTTKDGVVTLTGNVDSEAAKSKALSQWIRFHAFRFTPPSARSGAHVHRTASS